MSRYTALFAAALAVCSLHVSAQTASPASAVPAQAAPAQGPHRPCARPIYPAEALRNEATGVSTLAFLIGEDGSVKDAKIVKSSGHAVLDEAARDSLGKCQFKPAKVDGKPQEAWITVKYVWSID
jgi:TonB family protein